MKTSRFGATPTPRWKVRCRALAFLGSAFYYTVRNDKEQYDGPSIELVAHAGDEVVGLIDVESSASRARC